MVSQYFKTNDEEAFSKDADGDQEMACDTSDENATALQVEIDKADKLLGCMRTAGFTPEDPEVKTQTSKLEALQKKLSSKY